MAKIIKILEKKLKSLIKESVEEVLLEYYAKERSQYISDFKNKMPNYFSHWCLCYYSQNIHPLRESKHWKEELKTFYGKIANDKIKSGSKLKATQQAINESFSELDFFHIFVNKFTDENISIDFEGTFHQIFQIFESEKENLCIAISSGFSAYIDYIDNLFPSE